MTSLASTMRFKEPHDEADAVMKLRTEKLEVQPCSFHASLILGITLSASRISYGRIIGTILVEHAPQ